jgi:DNA-binding SARP family transcriptional activator
LPDAVEPKVATALRQLVSDAAASEGPAARVEVLGRFAVWIADRLATPASGLPSQLVKLLAVNGGRLPTDAVMEHLWPEGDLAGAGQRLRNVLHRLRDTDVVRRDGESLAFAPGTRIDLAEFESLATRALAAGDAAGSLLARQALALHGGPLLPDDLYTDWTISARERARRLQLDLLDLLAADAEGRGDTDAAIGHLETALAVDPDSESRSLAAARLHAGAGRPADALRLLDRARSALAELGVEPSREHRALRQALLEQS